ncbi:MAG: DUF5666 domain-containing protein [Candidatus Acidiferrales bacterium]
MGLMKRGIPSSILVIALAAIPARTLSARPSPPDASSAQAQTQSPITQQVGTVKAINGNTLTLTSDAGAEVAVTVQDTTKIVQVAPGQKDLKSAVPIHLADLQPGDRILVRSRTSPDAKTPMAVGIIAMKATDVAAKKTQESEDWQKRGIGGLVSAADPATGTITISTGAGSTAKTVAVHTTKDTILRRYAPDSVKFDDAKSAPLDQIKPGDQLRARGTRSPDGNEFQADEIVWGTFRNIAGIITSVDPSANTIALTDLITKKPVAVKITDQSQLRKLPERMAQFIAIRLKGAGGGAPGAASAGAPNSSAAPSRGGAAAGAEGAPNGGQHTGGASGGRADFEQIVNRLPAATLTDFQKGDAIMVVSTQGTDSGGVTAITLLGGVEPILAAAPAGNASQAMTLSPWSLGAPAGDAAGGTQ